MPEQVESIHALVREKYGALARKEASGRGCSCTCDGETNSLDMIGDAYKSVDGYVAEADLGLGCGLPTEHANIPPGETVLDLGAGVGIDAFVARRLVGENGQVYGVDMTPDMVTKARAPLGKRLIIVEAAGDFERLTSNSGWGPKAGFFADRDGAKPFLRSGRRGALWRSGLLYLGHQRVSIVIPASRDDDHLRLRLRKTRSFVDNPSRMSLNRGVSMLSSDRSIRDYCDRVWQFKSVGSEPEISS